MADYKHDHPGQKEPRAHGETPLMSNRIRRSLNTAGGGSGRRSGHGPGRSGARDPDAAPSPFKGMGMDVQERAGGSTAALIDDLRERRHSDPEAKASHSGLWRTTRHLARLRPGACAVWGTPGGRKVKPKLGAPPWNGEPLSEGPHLGVADLHRAAILHAANLGDANREVRRLREGENSELLEEATLAYRTSARRTSMVRTFAVRTSTGRTSARRTSAAADLVERTSDAHLRLRAILREADLRNANLSGAITLGDHVRGRRP